MNQQFLKKKFILEYDEPHYQIVYKMWAGMSEEGITDSRTYFLLAIFNSKRAIFKVDEKIIHGLQCNVCPLTVI